MSGVIYYIACPTTLRVKIGFTRTSAYERLAALQTGSPTKLCIVGTHPGSFDDERRLHQKFAGSRVHGEWFELTEEMYVHLSINAWLAAAQCEQTGSSIPAWLPAAMEGAGIVDAFPGLIGETMQ